MKPFNLKEYLANPSRKVVTRDGKAARIVCDNAKGGYPIIALVTAKAGYEEVESCHSYNDKGKLGMADSELDLFFAPEKKEGWINIYKDNLINGIYQTEREALNKIVVDWCYVTTIKIEWEE